MTNDLEVKINKVNNIKEILPIYYEYKGEKTVIRYAYTMKQAIRMVSELNSRTKSYTYGILTEEK